MKRMICAAACVVVATPGLAQSVPAQNRSLSEDVVQPKDEPATSPKPAPAAARAAPEGPLSKIGQSLADRGIYLRAIVVDEFAGNVAGGQGKGARNSVASAFGGDLDLDRLAGIGGGQLHVTFNKSIGQSLAAEDTLNGVSFQTRYKTFQNTRLAILAYEQDLFGGQVNVAAGRVSALSYFNASPIYCNFQSNAVCFNPAVVPIGDRGLSFFPYGTWGGRVKVSPNKRFYVQAGVFEANTALQPTNGFDFSTRRATGVQIPVEIGFQSASPAAKHAYHVRIGVYTNTSPYADPFLNTTGRPIIPFGGPPRQHDDQHSWYAMGDVVLYRPQPGSRRNLTLFGGTMNAVEDYFTYKSQTLLGLVYTGPFASRPNDTIGIVGSYLRLGDRQVQFLQAARSRAGGTDKVHPGEGLFELNYGFQLYRGVRLNPNIQYIVHPDNNLRPASRYQSKDIVAFGVRLSVELGDILGLPARR